MQPVRYFSALNGECKPMHFQRVSIPENPGLNRGRQRYMTTHLPYLNTIFATALGVLMLSLAAQPASAQTVTLAGNHPMAATSLTGRASAVQPLTIHVNFALRNRAKLQALLAAQQN